MTPQPSADKKRRVYTLVFPLKLEDSKVLLGMKKRGFGSGKWNGFGGKVDPGETIAEGAIREVKEECGLTVVPADLRPVGVNVFEFVGEPVLMEVHVFVATVFSGEVTESDEMRPKWYDLADVPYGDMWADDERWYPVMLDIVRGEASKPYFDAFFLFEGMETIVDGRIDLVDQICT